MSTALLLSLDEFLARPEHEDGQREELIEGELIVSPGAKVSHAETVRRLRMCLASLEDKGFVVANAFACVLPGASVPNPDLAVVKREHWDQAIRTDSWLAEAPEVVIEVASPGNRQLHRKQHCIWSMAPNRSGLSIRSNARFPCSRATVQPKRGSARRLSLKMSACL